MSAPLAPGSLLAPGYTVLQHLRRGSDADVYEVWSEERACRCIAKRLRPDRVGQGRPTRRLLREGRLLRRLVHLHLARAYDVIGSPPTLILEILTGQTLERRLLERGRLPVQEVALLGLQLGSVLHYLHHQPLLHLDLKPSNVVCERGLVKLLDLSIARPPGRVRPGVGTRLYMAPEQARGGRVCPATDVWGLGVVLFEAASGRRPFDIGPDSPRYPQLVKPAAPLARGRRVPRGLARAIDAALDPRPEARPVLNELIAVLQPLA